MQLIGIQGGLSIMGWRTVVVTQHAKVSLNANSLLIQTDQDRYHVPVEDVEVLLIQTLQAVITTAAISALAEVHAKIVFTGRSGQPCCEVNDYAPNARTAATVIGQVTWSQELIAKLWTRIVASKIDMQIQVAQFNHCKVEKLCSERDKLELNDMTNREAVVAHQYFPLIFGQDFSRSDFNVINAALNYGYSILLATINRAITAKGYLTCIGIHHSNESNTYNLGSDLMEPFRPIIDLWLSQHRLTDFTPDVKIGLIDLLNVELKFNGQKTIMRRAIVQHVSNCLNYLSGEADKIRIEVELPNEVSYHAINDHV